MTVRPTPTQTLAWAQEQIRLWLEFLENNEPKDDEGGEEE